MASGFFNIGISGLNAAQAGLLTAGHNISNASTVGYNRQYTVQTTNTPLFTGAGFFGQGTNVESIRRSYNDFLVKEVRIAETNVAELTTYAEQVSQIDNLLADPSAGLSPALQGFFKANEEAAANPASIPARQAFISAAQALVARFNALDQQLSHMRDGVNTQIASETGKINSLVAQVATLNDRILVAQAAASAQPANDLLDQRDALISELNKEIKVSVQVESDGSYSVFFGSGQPLVVGTQTYQVMTKPSAEDLTKMDVALKAPSGQVIDLPESLVTGGNLGGLLRFRSESLDVAQNNLGRVAIAMTTTINAQHRLGRDLDGDVAGDLFKAISPTVLGAPANVGDAVMRANITVSDYRVEYDGTDYTVTRLADGTRTTSSGVPFVVDGIRMSIASGTPQAGDVFMVRPGELPANRVTKLQGSGGSAVLSTTGSNLQTLTDTDYRLTMTAAGTFTLTRLSDDTVWTGRGATAAAAIEELTNQFSPQGFWLDVASGTPQVGDSFLIRPTRNAARDIALSVTDPRDVALAQGFRTGPAVTNAGTGKISAGNVLRTDVALSSPVELSYDGASNTLSGFPVGSTLLVGNTVYKIESATQRIPYVPGNYSFNGVGINLSGSPAGGDTFVVNPAPAGPAAGGGNTGSGAVIAGDVRTTDSLPAAPITLTYRQADTGAGLPARITGFPAGATVTVRLANGSTREYEMDSSDGFSDAAVFSDYVDFTDGATIEFNGMSFVISGNPAHGDSFTVGPNSAATGDNRNALALGKLQLTNTLGEGTTTFQSSYSSMVSLIGNKAREVDVTLTAQENLVKQGNDAIQSVSGVNLDEEAANLMRFQQAYQASAKMLEMSGQLFDLITSLGR